MERRGPPKPHRPSGGRSAKDRLAFRAELERKKKARTLQLLFKAARLANDRAVAHVRATRPGASRFRAAHTALFPHIDLEGTRLSVLAERAGVSKQAVGQLVDELEGLGILERCPDPRDGRAKLITFSAAGRRSLLDGLDALEEVAQQLARSLGRTGLAGLHRELEALLTVLEASEEAAFPT